MRYPGAVTDPDTGGLISDAEVAEVAFTAFASTRQPVTARLVVRRVRDQARQEELFPVWRYHPFFTNSTEPTAQADITHRRHAIIETVFADLIDGPLAHLPSGRFAANSRLGDLRGDHPQPATKAGLLELLDRAVGEGWSVSAAAVVLDLGRVRAHRWMLRAGLGDLVDRGPGGAPVHGLLAGRGGRDPGGVRAVGRDRPVAPQARAPRVVPAPVLGVPVHRPAGAHLHDKHFRPLPRPGRSHRRPFPEWAEYRPNAIWIYDTTHFTRAGCRCRWWRTWCPASGSATIVSGEETSTQVQLVFTDALDGRV